MIWIRHWKMRWGVRFKFISLIIKLILHISLQRFYEQNSILYTLVKSYSTWQECPEWHWRGDRPPPEHLDPSTDSCRMDTRTGCTGSPCDSTPIHLCWVTCSRGMDSTRRELLCHARELLWWWKRADPRVVTVVCLAYLSGICSKKTETVLNRINENRAIPWYWL